MRYNESNPFNQTQVLGGDQLKEIRKKIAAEKNTSISEKPGENVRTESKTEAASTQEAEPKKIEIDPKKQKLQDQINQKRAEIELMQSSLKAARQKQYDILNTTLHTGTENTLENLNPRFTAVNEDVKREEYLLSLEQEKIGDLNDAIKKLETEIESL